MKKRTKKQKFSRKRLLEARRILKHARKLISKGWTKGVYVLKTRQAGKTNESFCLLGALDRATRVTHSSRLAKNEAQNKLSQYIPKKYKIDDINFIHYNDDVKTSHSQVLATLDAAIATIVKD